MPQATASEGLAQGPYVADRAGIKLHCTPRYTIQICSTICPVALYFIIFNVSPLFYFYVLYSMLFYYVLVCSDALFNTIQFIRSIQSPCIVFNPPLSYSTFAFFYLIIFYPLLAYSMFRYSILFVCIVFYSIFIYSNILYCIHFLSTLFYLY